LPLSFRFGYILSGTERNLPADTRSASSVEGFLLPKGEPVPDDPATFLIVMYAYIRDGLGCETKTSLHEDGSVVTVNSTQRVASGESVVSFLSNRSSSLLSDNLQQGKVSAVLANVDMLSKTLSDAFNPCSVISCGQFGTCFNGTCTCDKSSGYTGQRCQDPPPSVDGVWSEWLAVGSCSVACGGGVQLLKRTCTPPKFGGFPCEGNDTDAVSCNTEACVDDVVVHGGWSEWTSWSSCSSRCPLGVGGYFVGSQSRDRFCNNPLPSFKGNQCFGNATQTRE
jgi:Thrombospondin type 1 domain